jgi:LuxR family maltose regulon positive regulatory protein
MSMPVLATKLYIPRLRPQAIGRPRLLERLNLGLQHSLVLVSAPAGFGKTTLVSAWVGATARPTAWLSLDEGDNDPVRFLTYLVAALQTVAGPVGDGSLALLQSTQPPEAALTSLLNELTTLSQEVLLVLDDYHVIEARAIDQALTFLLEHLPPQVHLVIVTREDPHLPLARLRAGGQLTEVRAVDLRLTLAEAATFLHQVMGLPLAAADVALLATRTEGWIAGLQLAALSLQGQQDTSGFIQSFTGSHRFVMDYLVEEVLARQSARVQAFLLRTSILDRFCASLCDAVLLDASASGRTTLDYLERANLFLVPLDNERRWYRYHHLFADLLQQRLQQSTALAAGDSAESEEGATSLHRRASLWYEDHGLELEAFHHAAAARDIERAARLVEGRGMPLQFRGAVTPVLRWLESLPAAELNARPSLWVMYASALSMTGSLTGVEEKLQAAEAALQGAGPDDGSRNLLGHIAAIRALVAAVENRVEIIITQSQRALEYLHPDNLAVRTATIWKLGIAYQLQGNRAAAARAYSEAMAVSQASGNTIIHLSAAVGLGTVQEVENQLYLAAQTYQRILQQVGDQLLPAVCEAHLGLARICYEWNDLDAAEQHGQQGLHLAQQLDNADRSLAGRVLLARVQLARGGIGEAAVVLAEAERFARQRAEARLPVVAAMQVLTLLRQGHLAAAARLAHLHELPLSQARVLLAQGDPSAALTLLTAWRQQMEARKWEDGRLQMMVLLAVALRVQGEEQQALRLLCDALVLAEPAGCIRLFVDEGLTMAQLLSEVAAHGLLPAYTHKLLAVCRATVLYPNPVSLPPAVQPLSEPLSQRELEVLQLIARGFSNREMSERLFLALDTVKGHNRKIFRKLQVQRRTEAVARARELGLL